MTDLGISFRIRYSTISDGELDNAIQRIESQFPYCGYRLIIGHLISQGIRAQQERVRQAMITFDPEGVPQR